MERTLRAADYLQLSIISDKCADLLKARMTPANVLGIRRFALLHNSPPSVAVADRYIRKHFEAVSVADEFAQLDATTLLALLACDELHVDSEEVIFRAAMRWIEADAEARRELAPRFFLLDLTLSGLITFFRLSPKMCGGIRL